MRRKDDNVLIRISHADKRRLIDIARQRGVTLSDLFRQGVIENLRSAA